MNLDDEFVLGHLLLNERKCRSCGEVKDLLTDFYRTRKNRTIASAYSYECKDCNKKRIKRYRNSTSKDTSIYPDW